MPSGFPRASTSSPVRSRLESPISAVGSSVASTRSAARSRAGSLATRIASKVPPPARVMTESRPRATCALVMTSPPPSQITPEPFPIPSRLEISTVTARTRAASVASASPTSAWCATALPVAVISATSSLTDCNIQIAHGAGADHARAYGMANAFGPKCREEIDRILNRMAAKLDKNVAQHHAGGGARTVRFDTQQHEARATWKPEGGDQLLWEADGLHRESDVAACHPSLREELLDDAPHGDVRYRDWLSTRQPGAVDPDDRAAGVDQRATGESVVNGD